MSPRGHFLQISVVFFCVSKCTGGFRDAESTEHSFNVFVLVTLHEDRFGLVILLVVEVRDGNELPLAPIALLEHHPERLRGTD
jgi:hypothetical protein